ncbi:MAG TPA: asparagine synthase (glutamine-hydrolyzing) [Burkholderiales bacterium]|nr:asparagine synthase (glutamine-hydrolyzing) [Burkholderiales bacterium]
MCGIAGILNVDESLVDQTALRAMIAALRHRGPDALGVYTDKHLGLAHARLSIIDLSTGQQPMHNEDKSIWITFNGEIFNYNELREELVGKGHRFATRSDTEVLIHLYEEKGEDCVDDLNGQWAFAIWDARRRKLFLSRDRLGVIPLFYTHAKQSFLFASEIKALLTHASVRRELDLQALDQLFTFWVTLPSRTIFQRICELPPGHSLILQEGKTRLRRYWQPDYRPRVEPIDEQARADRLLELLADATKLRLRSDVPVGAYLSGGIDSTTIVALIDAVSDTPLKTFSVTFDDPEFDERAFQREAVNHLHTEHSEIHCTHQDIARVFPRVIWHTEKPLLRTAPAPLYMLSQLVRQSGYKVVLTGEGADEMLGGYDLFKEAKVRGFWARFPNSKKRPLLLKRLYPYLPNLRSQSLAYLQAFFRVRKVDRDAVFFSHLPRWESTARLKRLFSGAVKSELEGYDAYDEMESLLPSEYHRWDVFSQAQYLETTHLLPGYILSSQGDRMAMAHGVEGRFPYLDHRLVDFAARLPSRLKMKVLNEKYLLKRAVNNIIPASIQNRSKQPYRAPDAKSFMSGAMPDYVEELLSESQLREHGVFNPLAVQTLMKKARQGQTTSMTDNMAFVGVLSTGLLIEQLMKGRGT